MLVTECLSEILGILYLFLFCHSSFDVCSDVSALERVQKSVAEGSDSECLN